MDTKSKKAKGRRLQNEVVKMLREFYKLSEYDVKPAVMGESGVDVKLSEHAMELIPFDIECKYQEKVRIWDWIKQAEANSRSGRIPIVVFRRNRSDVYAVIKFKDLLKLTDLLSY